MGVFGLFGKKPKQREEEEALKRAKLEDLEFYSGMRVEVTSDDGRIFLVGTLSGPRGDYAQLRPSTDGSFATRLDKPTPATLRGFSSKENKAVVLKGTIRPGLRGMWQAEHLSLVRRSNDRAYFRVDVDLTGSLVPLGRLNGRMEQCKVENISVGGACIGSGVRHNIGEKFILQVKLLPHLKPTRLMCQIVRIIERRRGGFEYGCRFLGMNEAEEERFLQVIYDVQRYVRS